MKLLCGGDFFDTAGDRNSDSSTSATFPNFKFFFLCYNT